MANHRKKLIDPSKPLKNPKYEIMANHLAKGSSQVDAYKSAYPNASELTARANACQVVAREGINERALKLLESVGLSEGKLASSLNECVQSSDERIKLDSTKFGLGMIGYGKEQKEGQATYNPTQINIIIKQRDTQPVDSIDVTPIKDE